MLRRVSFGLGVAIASFGLAAEPARLGDGPTTDRVDRPDSPGQVVSPYWQSSGDSAGLPATDIRAVPVAKAAAVQAKWTYLQLSTDLNVATRLLSMQLEAAPEYRQAVREESDAYNKMQDARSQALAGLENNDAYLAARQLRNDLTLRIREEHAMPKPDFDRVNAMAQLKLSYIADNRKLESDALSRDSDYQSARQNYLAAAQRVNELRQAQALTVAADDDLIALRRRVAEARIAKLTTAAYLSSSIRARNIAVRYATYYREVDKYRPNAGSWYPVGYYPDSLRVVKY